MNSKVHALTEGFPTFITFVGFLSCVDSLMALKTEIPAEVLIKHITFVGFLPSVDPLMDKKVGALIKVLPTLGALIRPFPTVDPLMETQEQPKSEPLPTHITGVGYLPHVDSAVVMKRGIATEAFATFHAFIGLVSWRAIGISRKV